MLVVGNLEIVKLYFPSVCVSCLCAQRHKKYTSVCIFVWASGDRVKG